MYHKHKHDPCDQRAIIPCNYIKLVSIHILHVILLPVQICQLGHILQLLLMKCTMNTLFSSFFYTWANKLFTSICQTTDNAFNKSKILQLHCSFFLFFIFFFGVWSQHEKFLDKCSILQVSCHFVQRPFCT